MSQIRRSAASIPANISEGFCRNTTKELIQFLYHSRGSCGETLYHLRLAKDLHYIDNGEYMISKECCDEIMKQLNGWIRSLRSKVNH